MRNIYLIGFMGSGKTSVADIAGTILERPVLDLDQIIEERIGRIKDIFREKGERVFRQYESEVLEGMTGENLIVSTGGGIVESRKNIDYMHYNGLVIYLQASFDEISKRLKKDANRPLWNQSRQDQLDLYNSRIEKYEKAAHHTIQTGHMTSYQTAVYLSEMLKTIE